MTDPIIASMFDESGNALRPWAEAGYETHAFDLLNTDHTAADGIHYHCVDLSDPQPIIDLNPSFLMGWPPCTDLAVSGAMHFENKRKANPNFQIEAVALARTVERAARILQIPWMLENPVSVMSTLWRKPDHTFHPWQYGGYLPTDDVHPRWPNYIAPRDRYPKKTCIWSGGGFIMPPMNPVDPPTGLSTQHTKLGGKSAKTKMIRSEGPRGFLRALFLANKDNLNV